MSRRISIAALLLAACACACACACGAGVPNESVVSEATTINKNAEIAKALHGLCVSDAGAAAEGCAKEKRALDDIESSANALLKAAGNTDAGGH